MRGGLASCFGSAARSREFVGAAVLGGEPSYSGTAGDRSLPGIEPAGQKLGAAWKLVREAARWAVWSAARKLAQLLRRRSGKLPGRRSVSCSEGGLVSCSEGGLEAAREGGLVRGGLVSCSVGGLVSCSEAR